MMESAVSLGKLELLDPGPGPGGPGPPGPGPGPPGGARPHLEPPHLVPGEPGPHLDPGPHLGGCVPLSHQVAGHKFGVDKVGILQHPDGTVLKQVQPPPRGKREMDFYGMVYADDCCDPCLLDLQNHLPRFYGTWSSPDSPNELYLKLQDVSHRFSRPCIMDVKLGQQSYDPYASQEKREQQIRKYPLMEEIGFLILGMRVYDVRGGTFDSYDQHYGRGLVKETVKDGLARFFHNGVRLREDAVLASIHKVQRILRWFDSQQQLAFYASSLLFVYEGLPSSGTGPGPGTAVTPAGDQNPVQDREEVAEFNNNIETAAPPSWDCSRAAAVVYANNRKCGDQHCREGNRPAHENRNLPPPPAEATDAAAAERLAGRERRDEPGTADVEVKMIDFAHVFPSDRHDGGYVFGLKHLLTVLEQILCDAAQVPPPTDPPTEPLTR
ncbi:inositol polyphosphate multikinase-like [Cololabis saira]|uniref:inositol polyphosphate multikinase-like n=1 Tax=Cololabis saira TaxID=129043 RepID=UPI002AD20367|nr:inositol polyphosphate multikinase-like [Cololabis saira]